MSKTLYPILFLIVLLSGCKSSEKMNEGIQGELKWVEGNLMPGPNANPARPKAVDREVYIFALTSMSEVRLVDGLFEMPKTKLIATTQSENGKFKVAVPPGVYSIFTKEENGFFANEFNAFGHINPVEVTRGEISRVEILINYMAAY
ncbi:carboxypeptidase regulatory-like domain-containing protein [Penaeicola halotolerans]|uniref:carboxypeptidase regulatory-like domain-containing protein n=1 Tax=Penaeicola halotolerans TaxID=2793196 RepID=UPI001CF8189C|nr:carboxypeptidase regulatory-like domain-containing protein [Penaeicola halotolerans]